jgi:hypothetical protein
MGKEQGEKAHQQPIVTVGTWAQYPRGRWYRTQVVSLRGKETRVFSHQILPFFARDHTSAFCIDICVLCPYVE